MHLQICAPMCMCAGILIAGNKLLPLYTRKYLQIYRNIYFPNFQEKWIKWRYTKLTRLPMQADQKVKKILYFNNSKVYVTLLNCI